MIERNVGSAALIGGNAKLGGSAWGAEKTDGTVLFDGTVTLTYVEDEEYYAGNISLNDVPYEVGDNVVITCDDILGSAFEGVIMHDHVGDYDYIFANDGGESVTIVLSTGAISFEGFTIEEGSYSLKIELAE